MTPVSRLTSNKMSEVATVHLSVNFWWSPNSTLARNLTVIGQKVICIRLTNRPFAATVSGRQTSQPRSRGARSLPARASVSARGVSAAGISVARITTSGVNLDGVDTTKNLTGARGLS
jgi:hypothetical protein